MSSTTHPVDHGPFHISSTWRIHPEPAPWGIPGDCFTIEYNSTGGKVETDKNGISILQQLPATTEKLIEHFSKPAYYLSPKLLSYYLHLFLNAGIIETERKKTDTAKPNTGSVSGPETGISVVIITYNGEKFIRKNLESLFCQTLPAAEIILVDNKSTDQSIDKIKKEFVNEKRLKIIRNKRNYHYANAVNIGVAAAASPLVIILNQDLELEPDFIQQLYSRYDAESDKSTVAGVVPQMRFSSLKPFINGIGNFITEKNWGSDNYFGSLDIGRFTQRKYVGSACFGAIMVTKEAWRIVGGLDKTYKSFYEDVDWSIRVHFKGLNILAAPKAIVYHAFGGSYPSGLKLTFIAKNRMRFVFKHLHGKIRTKFFIKYLKQDIKSILSFLRIKSYRNIWHYKMAYIKLFFEIPGILWYKMHKEKISIESMEAFFIKETPYVAIANNHQHPVINKHVIRSYYYYTEYEDFQYPTDPITYLY